MAKRQPHLRRLSAAPDSLLAAELSGHVSHDGLILAATSNARADACVVDPSLSVCLLPSWDCLPFDRVSPSRAVMGKRMTSLHRVRDGGRRLVICPGRDTGATRRPVGAAATFGYAPPDSTAWRQGDRLLLHRPSRTAAVRLHVAALPLRMVREPGRTAPVRTSEKRIHIDV